MYNNQYCSRCAENYRFCEFCKETFVRKSWREDNCPSCEATNIRVASYNESLEEDKLNTPDPISVKVMDIDIPFRAPLGSKMQSYLLKPVRGIAKES